MRTVRSVGEFSVYTLSIFAGFAALTGVRWLLIGDYGLIPWALGMAAVLAGAAWGLHKLLRLSER